MAQVNTFYNANHADTCIPNSSYLQVKEVRRAAIKSAIMENPTITPSALYNSEADKVRDNLKKGFKQEFDQLMPTQAALNPSIYAWNR